VRVRMGIHVGEVIIDEDDEYVGLAVHQAARISAAAHGGQVLTSKATQIQAEQRVPPGVSLKSLGRFRLKDFPEPQDLFQLHHPDLPNDSPLRARLRAPDTTCREQSPVSSAGTATWLSSRSSWRLPGSLR
jgi:class 3 adenylate cyclase